MAEIKLVEGQSELQIQIHNNIGAEGAKELAKALATNTTLTKLIFYNDNIGAEGATALAKALTANTTLTTLIFYNNNIGDEGAKELAKALATNTTLTTLSLNINNIGAEGAKELATIRLALVRNQERMMHTQRIVSRLAMMIAFTRANETHPLRSMIFQRTMMEPIVATLATVPPAHFNETAVARAKACEKSFALKQSRFGNTLYFLRLASCKSIGADT